MKALVADFESTVFNGEEEKTHVWLAGYKDYDVPEKYVITENIEDFIQSTMVHPTANIFMHNLENFDWHFLLDFYKKNGYQINYSNSEPRFNAKLVSVSPNGYYITVYYDWDNKVVHNYIDTMKYMVGSISEFGKRLGKPKGKTPLIKEGSNHQVSKFDKRYLKRDILILEGAMREFGVVEAYENGLSSYSQIAVQSMLYDGELNLNRVEGFKPHNYYSGHSKDNPPYKIESQRLKKLLTYNKDIVPRPKGLPKLDGKKKPTQELVDEALAYAKELNESGADKSVVQRAYDYYHYMSNRNIGALGNDSGRKAFRGGWFYINSKVFSGLAGSFLDEVTGRSMLEVNALGVTLDNNGLHAFMYGNKKLPKELIAITTDYKSAKNYNGEETLYVANFTSLKATVKANSFPILQPREDDKRNQRLNKYKRYPETIILKNSALAQPDYEYLLKHYEIEELKGLLFDVYSIDYALMKKLKAHVKKWVAVKVESKTNGDSFKYDYAKFMLNGLIGYFGVNKENNTRSDVVKASFIYSHARCFTAGMANKIGVDYFAYAGADSLHFALPPKALKRGKFDFDTLRKYIHSLGGELDDNKLGAWKVERIWTSARFLKVSTYAEETIEGEWVTKIAGYRYQVPKEKFHFGSIITQPLKKVVDGGVIFVDVDYKI